LAGKSLDFTYYSRLVSLNRQMSLSLSIRSGVSECVREVRDETNSLEELLSRVSYFPLEIKNKLIGVMKAMILEELLTYESNSDSYRRVAVCVKPFTVMPHDLCANMISFLTLKEKMLSAVVCHQFF